MKPEEYLAEVRKLDQEPDGELELITAILEVVEEDNETTLDNIDYEGAWDFMVHLAERIDEWGVGEVAYAGLRNWLNLTKEELQTQKLLNEYK